MNTTITHSGLTATINSKGAELVSLKKDSSHREYIWEGHSDFWGKHSPVLFPIVGTLKDNHYNYNSKTYQLSRHGFARDCEFELVESTENRAVFSLKADNESLQKYPFQFELQLIYTISGQRLQIAYKIFNNEIEAMPFSIGAHPAFALPKSFDSYAIEFENDEDLTVYELKHDLISDKQHTIALPNKILALDYDLFEKDAMIIKKMKSKRLTLLENDAPLLHFNYADFPNFGIWTKPNAPFICLEPWIGYSDTLHATGNLLEKEAIRLLAPQSVFEANFGIEIL